jgi:glycosyltransferase domain-containing protein
MKNKITIIIHTHNRPEFLRRVLSYYDNVHCQICISVADSSDGPYQVENFSIVEKFKIRLNLRYLHSDQEYYEKSLAALKMVDSDFVVFCGDKDFLLLNGLEDCVEFLETNADFVAVRGQAQVISNTTEVDFLSRPIIQNIPYLGREIVSDTADGRLLSLLSNFLSIYYSIYRTSVARKAVSKVVNVDSYPGRFAEFIFGSLVVISGKTGYLDTFYHVRQSWRKSGAATKLWHHEVYSPTFDKKFDMAIQVLAEELHDVMKTELSDGLKTVSDAMNIFFDPIRRNAKIQHDYEHKLHLSKLKCILRDYRQTFRVLKQLVPALLFLGRAGVSSKLVHHLHENFGETLRDIIKTQQRYKKFQKLGYDSDDHMSLTSLLKAESRYHKDFIPLYELVSLYPNGISTQRG